MAITWILMALVIVAAGALLMGLESAPRTLEERFSDLAVKVRVGKGEIDGSESDYAGTARMLLHWAADRIPAPKGEGPRAERLSQMLTQAGYMKPEAARMFTLIRLACVVVLGVIGLMASLLMNRDAGSSLLAAGSGAIVGAIIPTYYLSFRARRRQHAIASDLSDILDLLVVAVEAGVALQEAIRMVGRDAEQHGRVIGTELTLVASEMLAGRTLGQALRAWSNRTTVEDIKPLAATLIQSEQLGAQIGPAVRAASDALRAKRRLQAEEMAQKAAVKILFPLVFFVLPAMFLVIMGPPLVQSLRTLTQYGH